MASQQGPDAGGAADAMAALAAVLGDRLAQAAALADSPDDRAACLEGAAAATGGISSS